MVAAYTKGADPVHKISIIPRGIGALGYTIQLPTEDRFLLTEEELLGKIDVLLGGRASEQLFFGEISTGASNDIARATEIARKMISDYGMSDKFENVVLSSQRSPVFLPGESRLRRSGNIPNRPSSTLTRRSPGSLRAGTKKRSRSSKGRKGPSTRSREGCWKSKWSERKNSRPCSKKRTAANLRCLSHGRGVLRRTASFCPCVGRLPGKYRGVRVSPGAPTFAWLPSWSMSRGTSSCWRYPVLLGPGHPSGRVKPCPGERLGPSSSRSANIEKYRIVMLCRSTAAPTLFFRADLQSTPSMLWTLRRCVSICMRI